MRSASRRVFFASRPLASLAASFACGILLAHYARPPLVAVVTSFALVSALAVFAFARCVDGLASALVCAAFLLAGAAHATAERHSVSADRLKLLVEEGRIEAGEPVELTGALSRAPEVATDGFFVELRVEKINLRGSETEATGTVELFAPVRDAGTYARYDDLELRRGARVKVMAALSRAEEFRNPGATPHTEFLEREGYDASGAIKSPLLVERLDDERVLLPLAWLEEWRARLHELIGENFSLETAGVLQAAMLGNRHALSREVAERFREGGTFHFLVVSGLHVGFVGALAFWLAHLLTRRRAAQLIFAASLVWAYAVAVGAHTSVMRAALMFTFVALAPVVRRRADRVNALGGAALALLVWRPDDLFDPSFQLTFLSVAGIALVGWTLLARLREIGGWRPTRATPHPPRCPRWFRALGETLFWSERDWRRESARDVYDYQLFKTPLAARLERLRLQRALRYAFAAVIISASVQVSLLPLIVIYFHRLSLASVALNIYTGALMAFASLAALAAIVLSQFSHALAAPLVWSVERAVWLMARGVVPFNRAGLGALRLPYYTGRGAIIYVAYYVPLAALVRMLARWRPLELDTTSEGLGVARDRIDALKNRADAATNEDRLHRARQQRIERWQRVVSRYARRFAFVSFAALALVIVAHPLSAPRADGRLRIDFLDVGQGDSALITLPDGATLLVDGGGRPRPRDEQRRRGSATGDDVHTIALDSSSAHDVDNSSVRPAALAEIEGDEEPPRFERDTRGIGDAVVSEYLWWRGFARVDYLVATHAHADHMEGLRDVARNFHPRVSFVARTPRGDEEYARFAGAMRAAGVPVRLVARGDELRFGAVSIDVLYPSHATDANADGDTGLLPSGNDDSVVLRVRYGARCFLLTGDIERGAEGSLVAARDDLRCDVVKVAHHGSHTSSTVPFVAATRPAYAVVSVGLDSPFGHPDPAIVARWHDAGAQVLQTGRRGTITFSTDGQDLRVETFVRD
jgi:ComEC/Rec2-related protein